MKKENYTYLCRMNHWGYVSNTESNNLTSKVHFTDEKRGHVSRERVRACDDEVERKRWWTRGTPTLCGVVGDAYYDLRIHEDIGLCEKCRKVAENKGFSIYEWRPDPRKGGIDIPITHRNLRFYRFEPAIRPDEKSLKESDDDSGRLKFILRNIVFLVRTLL